MDQEPEISQLLTKKKVSRTVPGDFDAKKNKKCTLGRSEKMTKHAENCVDKEGDVANKKNSLNKKNFSDF